MAEAYADGWGRISDDFAKIERELLGMGPSDPELAQIAEAVESIDRAVKDQRRERRGQPAGMVTRIWVCRQVAFYKENPQLLKVDVSRRRVYMRDVWAMVEGEGRDKHGIKDFNHFARIYDTAQRDIRRKRGEG